MADPVTPRRNAGRGMGLGSRVGRLLLFLLGGVLAAFFWTALGSGGNGVALDVGARLADLVPTPGFLGSQQSGVPAKIEIGRRSRMSAGSPPPASARPSSEATQGGGRGNDSTAGQPGTAPSQVTVVPHPVFATQAPAPAARPAPPPAAAPAPTATDDHGRRGGGTPDPSSHP